MSDQSTRRVRIDEVSGLFKRDGAFVETSHGGRQKDGNFVAWGRANFREVVPELPPPAHKPRTLRRKRLQPLLLPKLQLRPPLPRRRLRHRQSNKIHPLPLTRFWQPLRLHAKRAGPMVMPKALLPPDRN